jgi:hypothetical protein
MIRASTSVGIAVSSNAPAAAPGMAGGPYYD